MSDEGMRYNFVFSARCAQCGGKLCFSYDVIPNHDYNPGTNVNPSITGAAMVENCFTVHHCEKCYSAATEPIRHLKAALDGAK